MNTDEIFALLSVRTVNFEAHGRHSKPLLTAQDVSAALGMCADQFAARIYHATHAPEYDAEEINGLIARALFEEWRARIDRYTTAQLAIATAKMVTDPLDRQSRERRARILETCAKAALWPRHLLSRPYVAIRRAVIVELRKNLICVRCNGHGVILRGQQREECVNCAGAGRLAVTDRQRASAIGVLPSTYVRCWRAVYDWLYWKLVAAIETGREQLQRALS